MTEAIFEIEARDRATRARAGVLRTRRGSVETPIFMPVATQGSVKALSQEDLDALGVRLILANSYHLYLRPGCELVQAAGGLARFMGYGGSILTDSGGFQIWSLAKLRKLTDEGVEFKSHLDGSSHWLTPESVIDVQERLGSDIWTALDECPPYPCDESRAVAALQRTENWANRAAAAFHRRARNTDGLRPLFFPILQGSHFPHLRRRAAEHAVGLAPDGICIGGLSVGEPKELLWNTLEATTAALPEEKPRYLMGVGTPEDLWDAVARGVDMMDCVYPTRVARNGTALVRGGRLSVKGGRCRLDPRPLDPECACFVCRRYSRAYIGHLMRGEELTAYRLMTFHNVHYMLEMMRRIRKAIQQGRFAEEHAAFKSRLKPATP